MYARSDVSSVVIPVDGGGCGDSHRRPVVDGKLVKLFAIDCPSCETYIRAHLSDQWTVNRWDIPLTEDEKLQAEMLEKRAQALQEKESQERARRMATELAAEASRDEPRTSEYPVTANIWTQVPASPSEDVPLSPLPPEKEVVPVRTSSADLARREEATERALKKMSYTDLRQRCKELGLSSGGSRDVLIDRLQGRNI